MANKRRSVWAWAAAVGAASIAQTYATRRYFKTSSGPTAFLHEDIRTAWTPAWDELLTALQWLRLLRSSVYRGEGVPHSHGAPVLLVQGFLTRPAYLNTLRSWLERIGYRARIVDLGFAADCYDVLGDRVRTEAETLQRQTGARVHLVGHSLGGVIVRAVAAQASELVASVSSLATPLRGLRIHPALRLVNLAARGLVHRQRGDSVFSECMTFACACPTVRALTTPLPSALPELAIVARGDGVADWRYEALPDSTRTVEVPGSHVGVVFEPAAYEALAHHLAAASVRGAGQPAAS
jgi:hypothetical protein